MTGKDNRPLAPARGADTKAQWKPSKGHSRSDREMANPTAKPNKLRSEAVAGGAKITPHPPNPLEAAKKVFHKWLELPGDDVLDFMFGVVFANRLGGDPVWGGIVGASGDTKTEILRTLEEHKDMYPLTSMTPQTLISGYVVDGGPDPSLLPKLNGKILIIKDLTPLIDGPAETRSSVLGQLRDAFDGSSSRSFGTGEVKRYKSRFGLLFGVTPVIETCWPVINSLGERFLYYRNAGGDALAKIDAALENSNEKEQMRQELAQAAGAVLKQPTADVPVPPAVSARIKHLADFAAKARTPVRRTGRTGEVEYVPVAEVGTRLAGQLVQLARGMTIARGQTVCDESDMEIILHVACSGIEKRRLDALRYLWQQKGVVETTLVGTALRLPTGTANLVLEDLWSLELVERQDRTSKSGPYRWKLSELAVGRIKGAGLFGEQAVAERGTP